MKGLYTVIGFLAAGVLAVKIMAFFQPLLLLLGLSVMMTYLLLVPVNLLERAIAWLLGWKRRARLLSVSTIFLGTFIVTTVGLVASVPVLARQWSELERALPRYLNTLGLAISSMTGKPLPEGWLNLPTESLTATALLSGPSWLATGLNGVFYGVTGLVLVFYFLLDGPALCRLLLRQVPAGMRVYGVAAHRVMGDFIKGQVFLAFISGGLMFLLYSVFQVKYALLLSTVFTVAEIVPVIGPWFAFTPGILVMLFSDNPWVTVYVLGIYFAVKDNIILPKVVGEVMGLHPIVVIAALMVAAQVAGLMGVLFAIPLISLLNACRKTVQSLKGDSDALCGKL
jgi:predicted PurR-regulated permease PerM